MYIVLCGAIGIFLFVLVIVALVLRRFCRCLQMKRFYPSAEIIRTRITLMLLAFLLEGLLLYGYFANTDLHTAIRSLTEDFAGVGTKLSEDFEVLIDNLPPVEGDATVYNRYSSQLRQDLEFSARYARGQSSAMETYTGTVEGLRMALILTNLILATISVSIGVTVGSIHSEKPLFVMVVCNGISLVLVFFSAGTHFAGSKIISEYCGETEYFLSGVGLGEPLPQRLQFFVPCVDSPVLPYIQDHFVVASAVAIGAVRTAFQTTSIWENVKDALPEWFNVTDEFYTKQIAEVRNESQRGELEVQIANARALSRFLVVFEESNTCSTTREIMREHEFLFCTYLRDNLDMLTMTQVLGGVLIAGLTGLGVMSLNLFRYAGKLHRRAPHRRRLGEAL
jgi:hypothetical protein